LKKILEENPYKCFKKRAGDENKKEFGRNELLMAEMEY